MIKRELSNEQVYDEEKDEYISVDTETTFNGVAVVSAYNSRLIDGTNILNGDVNIMASFPVKPNMNDTIEIGSERYTVINSNRISPNGIDVLYYDIQGR